MALYEGLVEYGPKDLQPIPALAKSWEISPKVDEFIFHLRENARWSDGTPITAEDVVYSLRRGMDPTTLSRTASMGFSIKNAEAFNAGRVFVKKGDTFVLDDSVTSAAGPDRVPFGPDTERHRFLHGPKKLILEGDEKKRAKQLEADPKLQAAVAGAQLVPIKGEDIGVEALDKYTVRITLQQSAPYLLGSLAHQFFRLVPRHAIEKWGKDWSRRENIVTGGPFRLREHRPYDALIVEKDPNYWDAGNVKLDSIEFYPIEEQATQMNLYKSGAVDALLNHSVPGSWISQVKQFKDEYLNFPETSTSYYSMNVTKPPFSDPKLRRAFYLAVDRVALSNYRKITKPLFDLTPQGLFPDYDKARQTVSEQIRAERGVASDDWAKRNDFDAEQARKILTEAGFPVIKSGDTFTCPTFPTDSVGLIYNTAESNRQVAEFVQAQWKRNLGITVPLKNMEFKTFLPLRNQLQYVGFAQSLWSGDYMDPYTFLSLHYSRQNDGASGFYDPKYDKMLDEANAELDSQKRYEMLARSEFYLMEQFPVVPLTVNATNWVKKPYVKGMYPNPGTLIPWKFVYIERDTNKWDRDVENIMSASDDTVDKQLQEINATQLQAASSPSTN